MKHRLASRFVIGPPGSCLALVLLVVACASCATIMTSKKPIRVEDLEGQLSDLGHVWKVSNEIVELVTEDSRGPTRADIDEVQRRNADAKTYIPEVLPTSAVGVRERVFRITIQEDGQELRFERLTRSCFEPGQGLSGIPLGGGCVESASTSEDDEWFDAMEQAIRGRL